MREPGGAVPSHTKTSPSPFVSPTTRSEASDGKATSGRPPTTATLGSPLHPFAARAPSPPLLLTSCTPPDCLSQRKTSLVPGVSVTPATRSVASDTNATQRPSALTDGAQLPALPRVPAGVELTRRRCAP